MQLREPGFHKRLTQGSSDDDVTQRVTDETVTCNTSSIRHRNKKKVTKSKLTPVNVDMSDFSRRQERGRVKERSLVHTHTQTGKQTEASFMSSKT